MDGSVSRKIDADIYIDDKNIGGSRLERCMADDLPFRSSAERGRKAYNLFKEKCFQAYIIKDFQTR